MQVSSRVKDESVYAVRQKLRENLIDHSKFRPDLESTKNKMLYKDVYQPNLQPDRPDSLINSV
jgi:hypothetical protein